MAQSNGHKPLLKYPRVSVLLVSNRRGGMFYKIRVGWGKSLLDADGDNKEMSDNHVRALEQWIASE